MNITAISTPMAGSEVSDKVISPAIIKEVSTTEKIQETEAKPVQASQKIEETREIADALNEIMDDLGTNMGFHIREDENKQVVVEVKNRETDELVRQIPSEELLVIRDKMEDLSGLLFDRQI